MSSERTPPPDLDRVEQGSTGDAIVADEGRQAPDDADRQPPNEAADASEDRPLPAATAVALSKPAPITTGRASAEQGSPEDPLVHPASPSESVTSEDGSGNEQLVPNPIAETIPAIADLSANDATQTHRSETTPVAATGGHQISVDVVLQADDINASGADGPWMAISATVTGAAHRRAGIGSQDAIQWEPHDQRQGRWLAMAVADGHGSSRYFRSDVGAKFAVTAACTLLLNTAATTLQAAQAEEKTVSEVARQLEATLPAQLLEHWCGKVGVDWQAVLGQSPAEDNSATTAGSTQDPSAVVTNSSAPIGEHPDGSGRTVSPSFWDSLLFQTDLRTVESAVRERTYHTAYGTTLMAVLITRQYLLCLHIGDGDIVILTEEGEPIDLPTRPEPPFLGVETTSLAGSNPAREFRVHFRRFDGHPPALVLLSTDGLANSFVEEEGFIQVGRDLLRVARSEGMGALAAKAQDLVQRATDEGCGDDVTLGIVCHLPTVQPALNEKAHSTGGEKGVQKVNSLLQTGETVQIVGSRKSCTVRQLLGAGGQGEVYRADCDGKDYALKWYFHRTATAEQRATIETLVGKGTPTQRFLWPEVLVTKPGEPGFGYLMGLRPAAFKGLVDLVTRRVEPSFRAKATLGYELSDSFCQLHSRGLCYRDISFGNVFFDPATGAILVCDNDNVAVDDGAMHGVAGTAKFMAPEVVRGDNAPSTQTDQFSLAVLLFYIFIINHPLEGGREAAIRCLDIPAMKDLYGDHPVFIFDPKDESNHPVTGIHDNANDFWPLYPTFLKDKFTQSFTKGMREPHERVRDSEWRGIMIRLRDSIFPCRHCGRENFYHEDRPSGLCLWRSCGKPLQKPMLLRVERTTPVVLGSETMLFPHHLGGKDYDFSAPRATVAQHPQRPEIWGLRNLGQNAWTVTADGETKQVDPGKSLTLRAGARINFGQRTGVVE